jgi:beta-galactosidase
MKFKFTLLIAILGLSFVFSQQKHTFQYDDKKFLLDGKPFQIISGEIHYTRVPKEAWRDRMKMAKAMGLNTIGTYIFWNVHEPQKENMILKEIMTLLNL